MFARSLLALVSLSTVGLVGIAQSEPGELTGLRADAHVASLIIGGGVVDADSNRPLAGVQVFIAAQRIGGLTNAAGRYMLRLDDSFAGQEVEISVELIGYQAMKRTVRLTAGENLIDFRLEQVALTLDEIVVGAGGERAAREERTRLAAGSVSQIGPVAVSAARQAMLPAAQMDAMRVRLEGNTESYAYIEENGFRAVAKAPLSTFSIDVDRASYANVRRFVTEGRRPPVDAVRIEELINYFHYSDPEPEGDIPFAVTTELAPAPWQPEHLVARIGIRGRSIDASDLPPSNFVFLLDVSGSMNSPDKLPLLKRSFRLLVDQLREEDRVAIVVYAGAAGLVLEPTSGDQKAKILSAIERLSAGGSTAGGQGLELAYRMARENFVEGGNNRVILATDGDFNVGSSSDAEMIRLIEAKREEGTYLTVLGFGRGNLKDSKMEQIADHGNGNFAYIDSELEAKKVLVSEMSGTLHTIAKDVKLQVEFNPALVAEYRLIGYENRALADEDFNDDKKDAGELGAGHTVTALYELILAGDEDLARSTPVDDLRFQRPGGLTEAADSEELMYVKLRYKEPDGDVSRLVGAPAFDARSERGPTIDLRFASAVAAWGMLLRDSEHSGDFTLEDVEELASGALGSDPGGFRAEFVELVQRSRLLELTAARGR